MGGLLTAGVVVPADPAVATDATVALVGDWVLAALAKRTLPTRINHNEISACNRFILSIALL